MPVKYHIKPRQEMDFRKNIRRNQAYDKSLLNYTLAIFLSLDKLKLLCITTLIDPFILSHRKWIFISVLLCICFFPLRYSADGRELSLTSVSTVMLNVNETHLLNLAVIRNGSGLGVQDAAGTSKFAAMNWYPPQIASVVFSNSNTRELNWQGYIDYPVFRRNHETEKLDLHFEDHDSPRLIIDPSSIDPFIEGKSATFTVKLDRKPKNGDVTVVLAQRSDDVVRVNINQSELTFSTMNWEIPQVVTVLNTDNQIIDMDEWLHIDLSIVEGVIDEKKATVRLRFEDNDSPNLILDRRGIPSFPEGTSATFTVKLDKKPIDGDVVVSIEQQRGDVVRVEINPSVLTFNTTDNFWSTAQTFTVSHKDNSIIDMDEWLSINLSSTGGGTDGRRTHIGLGFQDNDSPQMILNPLKVSSFPEGTSTTFTVKLDKKPIDGDVIVSLEQQTSAIRVRIDPLKLTFNTTDKLWSTAQVVTVSHTDDQTLNADEWVNIDLFATGGGTDGRKATIGLHFEDNDSPKLILDPRSIDPPAAISLEIEEGESAAVNVQLMADPSSNVTVTVTGYEGSDLWPTKKVLTFTPKNHQITQTVILNTTEDGDMLNDKVTLTLTASGGGYAVYRTLFVTILDSMPVNIEDGESPISFTLWGNYPNPVSDFATIKFDLPEPAQISVRVTDLLGRTVQTVFYGWFQDGQERTIGISTANLTSGVYYYTLTAETMDKVIQRSKAMSVIR